MAGGSSNGSNNGQDFDLNLAPIIDCFTVLIAFMLVSASFLSIGVLDAGVAAGGDTAKTTDAPPSINVTVAVGTDNHFGIEVEGKLKEKKQLESPEALTSYLVQLKGKFTDLKAITVKGADKTEYKEIIATMDTVRKTIPEVLLGGF